MVHIECVVCIVYSFHHSNLRYISLFATNEWVFSLYSTGWVSRGEETRCVYI